MRMARLGAADGRGELFADGPCNPASIRVRCALRSRKGADAGADDAGAKGPPRRGGDNALRRTECRKKKSPRGLPYAAGPSIHATEARASENRRFPTSA